MSEYVWSRRGAGTSLILVATCALFHCHASRGVDAPRVEPKPSPPSPAPVAVPKPVPTPMRISVRDPCWEPEPPVPEQGPLALWVRQAGLSDPERYWQAIPFWAKPCLPPSADGMNHHGGCGHGQVTCWQQPCPFLSDLAEDMDAPRAGEDVESHALAVPNAPPSAWRMIVSAKPEQVAAMSLWIDGRPAQLGMAARARQAWRSVTGGTSPPLLLVVTADADLLPPDAAARRQAASRIARFLEAQPAMGDLIAKFASVTE